MAHEKKGFKVLFTKYDQPGLFIREKYQKFIFYVQVIEYDSWDEAIPPACYYQVAPRPRPEFLSSKVQDEAEEDYLWYHNLCWVGPPLYPDSVRDHPSPLSEEGLVRDLGELYIDIPSPYPQGRKDFIACFDSI